MMTLGVIADTHIPDREPALPPAALEVFRRAQVDAILHAGDVVHPRVLRTLETLAPVYAVRGNRDLWLLPHLPSRWQQRWEGVSLGMCHSHGTLWQYLHDKWTHLVHGIPYKRFERRALAAFPQADVVVFGHIHRPVCRRVGWQLLCNPGSPTVPFPPSTTPATVALLFLEEGRAWGQIVPLEPASSAVSG